MITVIDPIKAFSKILHPFIVNSKSTRKRGNFFNLIKEICKMTTVNTTLNDEKL